MSARRITPSVDETGDLLIAVAALLLVGAVVITWFGWGGPDRGAFFGYLAAWFGGLLALFVGGGAAIGAARRRRFGCAPANLTMTDILGVVLAATTGIGSSAALLARGAGADVVTAIAAALAAAGLGVTLWLVRRLLVDPRPLRGNAVAWHRRSFDWNASFPPVE